MTRNGRDAVVDVTLLSTCLREDAASASQAPSLSRSGGPLLARPDQHSRVVEAASRNAEDAAHEARSPHRSARARAPVVLALAAVRASSEAVLLVTPRRRLALAERTGHLHAGLLGERPLLLRRAERELPTLPASTMCSGWTVPLRPVLPSTALAASRQRLATTANTRSETSAARPAAGGENQLAVPVPCKALFAEWSVPSRISLVVWALAAVRRPAEARG